MPDRDTGDSARRALWSGSLTFGLVSVPVALFPANRTRRMTLRLLAPDGTPLRRRYYCPQEGRPIAPDEIVRGYEIQKGEFVLVTDAELDALAPEKSREIDLRLFVPVAQIDPVYLDRTYFLLPTGDSPKAYRLLAATMENTGKAGIATFVMRGKEYLVAIEAQNGLMIAATLRFAAEIRTPDAVGLPAGVPVATAAAAALRKEIQAATGERLALDDLRDEYAERLRNLVERKRGVGAALVHLVEEPPEPAGAQVIDLMEVLKRSIEGHGSARNRRRKPATVRPANAGGDDLHHQSKAALYARASAMGLSGRSRMNKKELIEAIQKNTR
ncbi:MAG: Ku protein [Desulfobacterales bacterium]